ncbi:phosphoglycerate dehydrogenase-like enzyme [Pseudonocardia sediminis]|uniref:Phosphoglycerate dehydrogenase-like enzyme n=2 Tax=Pseudonocardia sediminis TaxID=1397368 RepID=A0A4Q7UTH4_PSEST|nr:D-2-hydroxyacid dehydrogenase [Pseudonocardia sediminis]RZT84081.1 phosphoglycerate dehydrogenase-like enzyme [Pseudonocardia sediminis]
MAIPAGQDALTITVLHGEDMPPGLSERVGDARLRFADDSTLADALPGSDVLLTWNFLSDAVRPAWATGGEGVRWVHTASAGVDRVAFPELLASDTTLTNSRGVFDVPMAEYVLGAILAFAKDLPTSLRLQDAGTWRHRETEPIAGRTAVVVGSGPIGHAITSLLRAAGLRVELVGRTARDGVHAFDALDGLLPEADFLVLAAPLTDQTRGLLHRGSIARMRDTARVVNVGRGPLIVQDDLVDALAAGRIAGAALDVFETEPLPADSPLWAMGNVIVSPHMSGDIVGWRDALVDLFAENLALFRDGRELRNVVDKARGYVSTSGGHS